MMGVNSLCNPQVIVEALLRDIFLKSARNLQFSRRLSGLTIQVSQGNREFPEGARMKEGDSIGVVHRHETSSADELGRCHPEWADVLQGSPFMQQRIALRLVSVAEPNEDSNKKKWRRKITRAAV